MIPGPERAPQVAQAFVKTARDVYGREMDFSLDSLGLVEEILDDLAPISPRPPAVPMYSTVHAAPVDAGTPLDAAYWVANLRGTVELHATVETVLADGHDVLVEVGPHPVLLPVVAETVDAGETAAATLPTLHRDAGDLAALTRQADILVAAIGRAEFVTADMVKSMRPGSVIGDLNSRRGQIQGQDMRGNAVVINAMVPLANMFGYVNQLRSFSQGRANYTMQFDHYEQVPSAVAAEVQAKYA